MPPCNGLKTATLTITCDLQRTCMLLAEYTFLFISWYIYLLSLFYVPTVFQEELAFSQFTVLKSRIRKKKEGVRIIGKTTATLYIKKIL
jgi:hypothetical protein